MVHILKWWGHRKNWLFLYISWNVLFPCLYFNFLYKSTFFKFVFQLFFRGKLQDEEGYVLYVRKNALQVLIPKYGLECTLYLAQKGQTSDIFEYNEEVTIFINQAKLYLLIYLHYITINMWFAGSNSKSWWYCSTCFRSRISTS